MLIAGLAIVSGCGSNAPMAASATDTGSAAAVVTTAAPAPPPPATAPAPSSGLFGEVAVADNFDTNLGIEPFDNGGSSQGKLPDESGEPIGAFRMICTAGQLSKDDPIVYPGQPGASHLHQFWGNTGTNANSTYGSLRTSGGTTCGSSSGPVNRTAYWMPAMLDGAGNVVKPDRINTYYKQFPAGSAECRAAAPAGCVGLPNGIRLVFGYNMATGKDGPTDQNSMSYYSLRYECWDNVQSATEVVKPAAGDRFRTLAAVVNAGCPAGATLVIHFSVPGCWDGTNLDSADHRSHLSFGTPETGGQRCPTSHPYLITPWQGQIFYTTDANFVAGKWRLASDAMAPNAPAGSTLHFDYFEGWSPTIKQTWQARCIDAHKTCSQGDLGNGMSIKQTPPTPAHQLIPLSSL